MRVLKNILNKPIDLGQETFINRDIHANFAKKTHNTGAIVNYFQMHIGDWAQATAHLSPVEEAAYHRLLHLYYHTEAPIPNDPGYLSRKLRMRDEEQVILLVLQEFFSLDDDVWRQKRCDKEIAAYQRKVTSAKKAAKIRYEKHQSDQNTTDHVSETHSGPSGNHKPRTNNQEPVVCAKKSQKKRTALPNDFVLDSQRSETAINYWNKKGRADLSAKVEEIFEAFIDHCVANGKIFANWDAAWRTWYSKTPQFERLNHAERQQSYTTSYERSDKALEQYLSKHCA